MQHDHSISAAFNAVFTTAAEKAQAVIAAGAIMSPLWRQALQSVSEDAALVAPILGCLWLVVQIGAKVGEIVHRRRGAGGG